MTHAGRKAPKYDVEKRKLPLNRPLLPGRRLFSVAAQGLKQRCGIHVAAGSGLGTVYQCLLVGLLRDQQRQGIHRTDLILPACDIKARLRQRGCTIRGLHRVSIRCQHQERIGRPYDR